MPPISSRARIFSREMQCCSYKGRINYAVRARLVASGASNRVPDAAQCRNIAARSGQRHKSAPRLARAFSAPRYIDIRLGSAVKYIVSRRRPINPTINAIFSSTISQRPISGTAALRSVNADIAFAPREAHSRSPGTKLEAPEIDCGFERDDSGQRPTCEKDGQHAQADPLDHDQVRDCRTRSDLQLLFRRMERPFDIMCQHCHVKKFQPHAPTAGARSHEDEYLR
jgi:hypothetical protein